MFDLSLSEVALVCLVSILVIKPEDVPSIIRQLKQWKNKIGNVKNDLVSSIHNIEGVDEIKSQLHSAQNEIKTIIDLNGNPQRIYDIDEIRKDLNIQQLASPMPRIDNTSKKDDGGIKSYKDPIQ
jgi:Sec-independent protein translocase protein TatA